MTDETREIIEKELAFVEKLNKKHVTLTEDLILKVVNKHQKDAILERYMEQGFNFVMENQEQVKQFMAYVFRPKSEEEKPNTFQIEIEPNEPVEFENFVTIGDSVTLRLGNERLEARVFLTAENTPTILGRITSEMLFTEEHGAKTGDLVEFEIKHIFKHEPAS